MNKIPTLTWENLQLPDDELGKLFLGFVVAAEAHAEGVSFDHVTEAHAAQVIGALEKYGEATDSRYSTVEKAVRHAIAGDFPTAGRLIREYLLDDARDIIVLNEAVTRTSWRRKISSGDRGDALTQLIRDFVEDADGDLSESELITRLKNDTSGVVDEITVEEVWYVSANGTGRKVRLSNLRGRLSRAKAKYKN